jgi:hypothetical protein
MSAGCMRAATVSRMDGPTPRLLASLMRAVAIAALPAAEQEVWLRLIGLDWSNVDEIAMEIGDGTLLAPQFVAAGWFPASALEPLRVLDASLTRMSGEANAHLWTLEALRTASEWTECRQQALRVLLSVN